MIGASLRELVDEATRLDVTIGSVIREREAAETGISTADVNTKMNLNLEAMREASFRGLAGVVSRSGLTGGDARKSVEARRAGKLIGGEPLDTAISISLAVAEVNAAMGRIVAAPTAGSCGVLPGVILAVGERIGADNDKLIDALFTAGGVGSVISRNATLAGAEGGCQAECGAASAMAAAAAVQLAGGSPEACANAAAFALKGLLGLVCDPVGGLVEAPCIKRNATAAAVALASADMALAGIVSVIPPDEVIEAMGAVGRMLPESLRETALGGLAATPTGKALARKIASMP
ncbi:MAG: L-serine ammonia-lyase, iron-sulfur-dependent, subunit alpha [Clostridia bacterium]|nr:L-serine ammonia-lyase, iron-sulfur-dependent, subunit alpha [Clostridia bacterium]